MSTTLRVRLILGVTLAIAIGTAMAWRVRGATAGGTVQSAQPPVGAVRVERTLVRVSEQLVERPVRRERAHVRPQRGTVAPPLISRARRVLFGSGRYRPDPFPRASARESTAR